MSIYGVKGYTPVSFIFTVDCHQPPTLGNGTFNYTSTVFKSNVIYRCREGFVLKGQSTRTCNSDAQWTNETIICNPIGMAVQAGLTE